MLLKTRCFLFRYSKNKTILKFFIMAKKSKPLKKDPCWDGYEQAGMKKKNGKKVPNCVPEKKKKSK